MNEKIRLNSEICEFIGAFIGDGYLSSSRRTYTIGISGDQKLDEDYLKNYLKPLVQRNFPFVEPRLYYRTDENTLMLKVNSKRLYSFFTNLGFKKGKKSSSVKIPSEILNNDEFMSATLRGIFDTDGCIFFDKRKAYKNPYPRITLQLASLVLIDQIEQQLSKNFTLYVNKSNRDGYRNYVEIYGLKQLERFLKKVGLSNKRHLDKVKNMPL